MTMNWDGLRDYDDEFFESKDRISAAVPLDLVSSGSDECRISFAWCHRCHSSELLPRRQPQWLLTTIFGWRLQGPLGSGDSGFSKAWAYLLTKNFLVSNVVFPTRSLTVRFRQQPKFPRPLEVFPKRSINKTTNILRNRICLTLRFPSCSYGPGLIVRSSHFQLKRKEKKNFLVPYQSNVSQKHLL